MSARSRRARRGELEIFQLSIGRFSKSRASRGVNPRARANAAGRLGACSTVRA
jgi:hypothetical protein